MDKGVERWYWISTVIKPYDNALDSFAAVIYTGPASGVMNAFLWTDLLIAILSEENHSYREQNNSDLNL